MNDGSPDNCLQIIKDLKIDFPNIVLIDQVNQGVSVARNNGIKCAKAKYLMMVDPDDAIQNNCLKDILSFAEDKRLEIVYSPLSFVEMDGTVEESKFNKSVDTILKGTELYFAVRGKNIIDPDRSYAILYRRDLIIGNKLFYLKDVPYLEDGEFIARVLCLAKKSAIYNVPYYLRLNRPGSATRSNLSNQKRSIIGFILAAKNLEKFKNNNTLSSKQIGLLNGRIIKFVVLAVHASIKKPKIFIWLKKELRNNNLINLNVKGVDIFYLKLGKQYNQSINLFYINSIFKYIYIYLSINKLNFIKILLKIRR